MKNTSSGISFTDALTILFIGLKLGKVISWPWIWVLSPIWISAGVVVAILLVVGVILLLNHLFF